MTTSDNADRQFDDLFRVYELYTKVQLQAETIYYNRSNLLLVAQGLLFVALPQTLAVRALPEAIAGLGLWLSILWWGLEQRQLVHHQSRQDAILKPLEQELCELAERSTRGFRPFWEKTDRWVADHAHLYQRQSIRRILRNYTPLTFVICWGLIFALLLSDVAALARK